MLQHFNDGDHVLDGVNGYSFASVPIRARIATQSVPFIPEFAWKDAHGQASLHRSGYPVSSISLVPRKLQRQEKAAVALAKLDVDRVTAIAASSGLIPPLVELVRHGPKAQKTKAALALSKLSTNNENRSVIVEVGVYQL